MAEMYKRSFTLTIIALISVILLAFISVPFASSSVVQAATVESPYVYGDASEDGYTDSFDLVIMQNMILEKSPVYPGGDASCDGYTDSFDLVIMQNVILEKLNAIKRYDARYNFSSGAGINRWAMSNSLSVIPPSLNDTFNTDSTGWVEATLEQYTNIFEEHTDVWTITASSNAALQCKFTIDEGADSGDITSIRVYFNGSSEYGGDLLKFWVWNFTSAEWTQIGPGVTLSVNNESYNSGWTAWGKIYDQYIDGNNYMYVLLINTASASDLNVNYIELELVTPTVFAAPQPTPTVTIVPTETPSPTPVDTILPTPTSTIDIPTPTPTATGTVIITPTPTPTSTSVNCEHVYDFAGVSKISGPHDAYYLSVFNMPPPHWRWYLLKTEATDGEYAAISAGDDSRWQTPYPGRLRHVLAAFEMIIDETPVSVNKIDLFFEGYGEVDSTFEIWAYNFVTGKGERIGSKMDIQTGYDSGMVRSIVSNCGDYISEDGKVIWGVYEKEITSRWFTDGYWMAIDYVKLVVTTPCP